MIDNYKQEHMASAKKDRNFTSAYLINVVTSLYFLWRALFGTGMINQLPPLGRTVVGVIIGLLSFNTYYLLSQVNWRGLGRGNQLSLVLTFLVVTVLLTKLDFTALPRTSYGFGLGMGHGVVIALSAISLIETIWLYPQFRQRRD